MDKGTEKKKELTDRLLAISGEKYLNGIIPLAKGFIQAKNKYRIELLKELLESGCHQQIIVDKLSVEFGIESELELIEAEIRQLYKEDVSFMN